MTNQNQQPAGKSVSVVVWCGGSRITVPVDLARQLGLREGQQVGPLTAAALTARKFEMAAHQKKGH